MLVDKEGHLLEASVANMAVVLPGNVFLLPPFDKTLQGTTSMKCLDFIKSTLIPSGVLSSVLREHITPQRVKAEALELMLLGGDDVVPVTALDDSQIGDGQAGPISQQLRAFILKQKSDADAKLTLSVPKVEAVEKQLLIGAHDYDQLAEYGVFREEAALMLTLTDDIVERTEEDAPMELLNVAEEIGEVRIDPSARNVPFGSRAGANFDKLSGFYQRPSDIPFSHEYIDDPELMQAIQASLLD